MRGVKIKVCGMTDPENIQALAALRPDYMGLIFYEKSKRYAGATPIAAIDKMIGSEMEKVGVFVNEDIEEVTSLADEYGIKILQLHGDEDVDYCKILKSKGYQIIKAFSIGDSFEFEKLIPYKTVVDYFLFDTKGAEYGGNGVTFDWSILNNYDNEIPFFLSGGLSADNIATVLEMDNLNLYAVDVNSKFETSPGYKDIKLLKESVFTSLR